MVSEIWLVAVQGKVGKRINTPAGGSSAAKALGEEGRCVQTQGA